MSPAHGETARPPLQNEAAPSPPGWPSHRQFTTQRRGCSRYCPTPAPHRQRFGRPLPSIGGLAFAAFPSAERLAAAEEAELRALGLGYRAKFVISTAKRVQSLGGESWLASLRGLTRQAATTELQSLAGVGPKVADCVALFSLDQASAIPVDTHVWAIACRDMDPSLKQAKSLTPKVYDRVVQLFT